MSRRPVLLFGVCILSLGLCALMVLVVNSSDNELRHEDAVEIALRINKQEVTPGETVRLEELISSDRNANVLIGL
jgi:hypothetical protein